jgi:hypothetical protein
LRLLFPKAEFVHDLAIAIEVVRAKVLQVTAALTYHLEETAAGMMIVLVRLQVLGQVADPSAQERDLHFRGSRIRRMPPVGVY